MGSEVIFFYIISEIRSCLEEPFLNEMSYIHLGLNVLYYTFVWFYQGMEIPEKRKNVIQTLTLNKSPVSWWVCHRLKAFLCVIIIIIIK